MDAPIPTLTFTYCIQSLHDGEWSTWKGKYPNEEAARQTANARTHLVINLEGIRLLKICVIRFTEPIYL